MLYSNLLPDIFVHNLIFMCTHPPQQSYLHYTLVSHQCLQWTCVDLILIYSQLLCSTNTIMYNFLALMYINKHKLLLAKCMYLCVCACKANFGMAVTLQLFLLLYKRYTIERKKENTRNKNPSVIINN